MMFLNDITIIITTFFSEKKVIECLNSINNKCKVIIVENSRNEKLKVKLQNNYQNLQFILTNENIGYSKSNNLALKIVKTKYALVLNPDTILKKNTLEKFLEASNVIKDFAILGPYIQTDYDKKKSILSSDPISVQSIKGFAMFFNMEKFNKIGFFDENFFLYFEDIDLCRKVIKNNNKIYLLPNIEIDHKGAKSVEIPDDNELEYNRNWHWMWSSFYYHKKHNGNLKSLIIFTPKLINTGLKFLIYSILGRKNKIYYFRLSGLFNSMIGKKSWYRPKV